MAELFVDIAFIHLRAAGKTRAQTVAAGELDPLCIGQTRAQANREHAGFDQPRDVFIIQPPLKYAGAMACGGGKDRPKGNFWSGRR